MNRFYGMGETFGYIWWKVFILFFLAGRETEKKESNMETTHKGCNFFLTLEKKKQTVGCADLKMQFCTPPLYPLLFLAPPSIWVRSFYKIGWLQDEREKKSAPKNVMNVISIDNKIGSEEYLHIYNYFLNLIKVLLPFPRIFYEWKKTGKQ